MEKEVLPTTHSPCMSTSLHTQHYQPHCFPQLAVLHTQQTQVIVCKMAQDVGLCESIACSVIPMLFEGDVLVFVQKTFFVSLNCRNEYIIVTFW